MKYNFSQWCKKLDEKQGVLVRVNQNEDIFKISYIVNSFLQSISNDTDKKITEYYMVLYHTVTLYYIPTENLDTIAKTSHDLDITLYKQLTPDNYLEIKYSLIHELIHCIQNLRKKYTVKDYTEIDNIRIYVRKLLANKIYNDDIDLNQFNNCTDSEKEYKLNEYNKRRYFSYLLYREELDEIYAWSNDAYIMAYIQKVKNPDMSNSDIMTYVINDINMSNKQLLQTIDFIKTDEKSWEIIVSILFSHLPEFGKKHEQIYFDRSIFELEEIEQLRPTIQVILKGYKSTDTKSNMLITMVKNTAHTVLLPIKKEILNSFIDYIKYWHKKAIIKIGKAIQLGIEDGSPDSIPFIQ